MQPRPIGEGIQAEGKNVLRMTQILSGNARKQKIIFYGVNFHTKVLSKVETP